MKKWLRSEVVQMTQFHKDYQLKHGVLTYEYLLDRDMPIHVEEEENIHSDRRLALHSYALDTFGLIVVPMIRDK